MLERINKGILLDVRTEEEYQSQHAKGSHLIPLAELPDADLEWDKETPIFVHCQMGGRAEQAMVILKEKGYTSVTNLGGISDLEKLGLVLTAESSE